MAQEELQESKLTKAGGRKPTHGCNYPMVGWPSVILTPMGPSLNLTREGTSRPSLRSSLSLSLISCISRKKRVLHVLVHAVHGPLQPHEQLRKQLETVWVGGLCCWCLEYQGAYRSLWAKRGGGVSAGVWYGHSWMPSCTCWPWPLLR